MVLSNKDVKRKPMSKKEKADALAKKKGLVFMDPQPELHGNAYYWPSKGPHYIRSWVKAYIPKDLFNYHGYWYMRKPKNK